MVRASSTLFFPSWSSVLLGRSLCPKASGMASASCGPSACTLQRRVLTARYNHVHSVQLGNMRNRSWDT
jgi:hypothetical protein